VTRVTALHPIRLDNSYEVRINAFLPGEGVHLFNSPAFFQLHAATNRGFYYQLCQAHVQRADATLHFTSVPTRDTEFRSPLRGTFGGLSCSDKISLEHREAFLQAVETHLRGEGATELFIKEPPARHDLTSFSLNHSLYLRRGYEVAGHELNSSLSVCADPFVEGLDPGNRKRLRKASEAGYHARTLSPEEHEAAYQLIAANRERRGFPFSMSWAQVMEMRSTFPDRFVVFGVEQSGALAAAGICLRTTPVILYVYAWGEAADAVAFSPVTLLAACIYDYCRAQGVTLMDLGTSTVEGQPNYGLLRYKRHLGARESLQLRYMKQLIGGRA
jgi:hypothetical protein